MKFKKVSDNNEKTNTIDEVQVTGDISHAEGINAIVNGNISHSEGYNSYPNRLHSNGFWKRVKVNILTFIIRPTFTYLAIYFGIYTLVFILLMLLSLK